MKTKVLVWATLLILAASALYVYKLFEPYFLIRWWQLTK
jgi:hypothetical protein